MTQRLNLPDSASIAHAASDGRLHAPSAARNVDYIGDLIAHIAPATGTALELASGTGQHVVSHAARFTGMTWQPSDVDDARLRSIASYVDEAALVNVLPPVKLDATTAGWGADNSGKALVLLVNLLHLISEVEARTLISEAAVALSSEGRLVIYGPFMRGDDLTSDGDTAFHNSLRAQDPEIGYKSDFDVVEWGLSCGLTLADVVEMPANNLAIIWRK
jgi:hypothetical protein